MSTRPPIDVYYDGKQYLMNNGRDFVPINEGSLRSHLKLASTSDIAEAICQIQMDKYVKYTGPIAGAQRGVHTSPNGDLLLATSGPRIIDASPGPFPTIRRFLKALIGADEYGDAQLRHFVGWLKISRQAMLAGKRRPGQALVLAGPIQCGKTQLIKQLIVPSMGGRSANPYKFLSGKTQFNGELLGAEVLVIDDVSGNTRIEARRTLGDGIKNTLFAATVSIEAKYQTPIDYAPLWRLVIAVNDEPESLLVLPPLSKDLDDKLMILKCEKAIEFNDAEFDQWKRQIIAELPAFLHFVENFEIPEDESDGRCGVACFRHPAVVESITGLSPENALMDLVRLLVDKGELDIPWEGTAAQLKAELLRSTFTKTAAERLLIPWAQATGVYLSRLLRQGVEKLGLLDGTQRYRITGRPAEVEPTSQSSGET